MRTLVQSIWRAICQQVSRITKAFILVDPVISCGGMSKIEIHQMHQIEEKENAPNRAASKTNSH